MRFVEQLEQRNDSATIDEEFRRVIQQVKMDAATTADTHTDQAKEMGLKLDKLHGQSYDKLSAMAGNDDDEQTRIRNSHPKSVFVLCCSH